MNTQCVNRTALVFCGLSDMGFKVLTVVCPELASGWLRKYVASSEVRLRFLFFPFFAWGIHVRSWSMCVYRSKVVWPWFFWWNLCIDEQMNCCFQLSLEDSNIDKRLGVHAHLVDKQSEDHKRNNSYHAIAHPANTSFQNVKWKRCCKDAVFYWLKMAPSFDHNDQFMDYLHFKYKV